MKSKILLVEDEPLLREMTGEDLRDLGYSPTLARNGDEALEMLESAIDIEILITDIRMPGNCDGWELARRARELHPDLGVIYISGFSGDETHPVPGSIFLKKPYRIDQIEQALAEAA